jgi:leader peptidase (prepilin peptidase)/N-methyltransferase
MEIFFYVTAFLFGACIGSFLNVCIYRLPREGLSVNRPRRSICFSCKGQIAWYDNIPILSYFLLHGRCRRCGSPFSVRYALVEALTGILFVLVVRSFWVEPFLESVQAEPGMALNGPAALSLTTLIYLAFTAALVVCTFIDLDHFIIPDEISIPGMVIGLILGVTVPFFVAHLPSESHVYPLWEPTFLPRSWWEALLGGALGGGLLWGLRVVASALLRKEALGFGDVKLITMIGFFLGWKLVLVTIFLSAFLGIVIALPMQIIQRKGRFSHIPYGPYIALAAYLCMLWGDRIFNHYLAFGAWISQALGYATPV